MLRRPIRCFLRLREGRAPHLRRLLGYFWRAPPPYRHSKGRGLWPAWDSRAPSQFRHRPNGGVVQGGMTVKELLPNLSVYLGHVQPAHTYWYLTATPELLGAAADRFLQYAGIGGHHD